MNTQSSKPILVHPLPFSRIALILLLSLWFGFEKVEFSVIPKAKKTREMMQSSVVIGVLLRGYLVTGENEKVRK